MKDDPFAQEYKEAIDADAVCGQCGRVNPEGTLICKGCGNNLRDQRLMRLAADQMLTGEEEAARRRSMLKGGLTVLGILVVIWVGINAGGIMGYVVPGSVTDATGAAANMPPITPNKFWESEEDKTSFDAMAADLKSHYPTEGQADTARLSPSSTPSPNGYFALFQRIGTTETFAGAAYASQTQDGVSFVAELADGTQIRGKAAIGESAITTDWYMSGVEREGKFYAGAGSAIPQTDGSYQVVARSDAVQRILQAIAYPMSVR